MNLQVTMATMHGTNWGNHEGIAGSCFSISLLQVHGTGECVHDECTIWKTTYLWYFV